MESTGLWNKILETLEKAEQGMGSVWKANRSIKNGGIVGRVKKTPGLV